MTKLIDLCDIQYGYAFDSNCFSKDNSYPQLARIRDVKRGYSETFYTGKYPKEYVLSAGDLLIGMDGEFNVARWKIDGALLNQRVCKVVAKNGTNEEYIRFFLLKQLKTIEEKTSFVTVKHLSAREINKIEVDIPKLCEQEKIATALLMLERIEELRNRELLLLDELVRGRFVELFGDIISNEKGWETDIWSNVLKIVNGKNQKAVESEDGEYLICGSGGAMGRATEYLTNENSVIIGRKGSINKPLLMREKYWNVDTAFGIEPNTKYINVDYLYMFCVFFNFEKLNKAVTIPSLTKTDLLNIEMPIPNILLQNQFADFVHQIDKSKFGHLSMLTTMKSAYDQQTFIYP